MEPMNKPLVSVSMISYNAEAYIADAIESVLNQQTEFSFELVIGDDASTDGTRAVAEAYANRHPGIIRLLPKGENLGIAANTARNFSHCRGKYIAICDGDDVWADPLKLQKQVHFLEQYDDYGISYSDVATISETSAPLEDPEILEMRTRYKQGDVFFDLLQANFISNSSAVFRRKYLDDHLILPARTYHIQDHILWLHIAARGGKAHFVPERTTLYRKHSSALTVKVPRRKQKGNRQMFHYYLHKAIVDFDKYHRSRLTEDQEILLFRRMLSIIYRRTGTSAMKLNVLWRMPRYFPGIRNVARIFKAKMAH